jgi:hypothetical protein
MATFTDLSQSTQAGDPVVSTLTSGLDRNQIAAFEGDPTATVLIQAKTNAFSDSSVTGAKLSQTAINTSLSGVDSMGLYGAWTGEDLAGNETGNPYLRRRIGKSGTYRFRAAVKITTAGSPTPLGNAQISFYKNATSTNNTNPGGTLLDRSAKINSANTWVYLDSILTLEAGDSITMLLDGFSHFYTPTTFFESNLKIYTASPSYEAQRTLGYNYQRIQTTGFYAVTYQIGRAKFINWDSSPYPGDLE